MAWTYLIETNVVSEAIKPVPDERVTAWMASTTPGECCLSVLTIAELTRGIVLVERRGGTTKAANLRAWLGQVEQAYAGRILDVNPAVARAWADCPSTVAPFDSLLAATARAHGLTVVTRNTRDFEGAGVPVLDPFAGPDSQ